MRGEPPLAAVDRHPGASISSLIPFGVLPEVLAQRAVREARNADGRAALTPRHFASARLRQRVSSSERGALYDEWRHVMLYAVSAKLILDRAPEFHTRLTDGSVAAQRPDGAEIVAAMHRARVAGRHGALDRDLLLPNAAPPRTRHRA